MQDHHAYSQIVLHSATAKEQSNFFGSWLPIIASELAALVLKDIEVCIEKVYKM